jgi:hypothetical protein
LQSGRSTTGGAIYIDQGGSVTSYNCIFQGNTAAGVIGLSGTPGDASDPNYGKPGGPALPGWPGLGGAICNRGNLEVYSCQFLTNSALGGSGGSGGNGAAGTYQGGNGGTGGNGNVGYGGAIYNSGTVDVTNCAFTGKTAVESLTDMRATAAPAPMRAEEPSAAGPGPRSKPAHSPATRLRVGAARRAAQPAAVTV